MLKGAAGRGAPRLLDADCTFAKPIPDDASPNLRRVGVHFAICTSCLPHSNHTHSALSLHASNAPTMSQLTLLDTPERTSLQSRVDTLRTALKDFERSFSAENGKKPGKEDIKANEDVSRKYKEYSKLRDVIAGKLGLAALEEGSPKRKRQDKHAGEERKRRKVDQTPRKQRVAQEGSYDEFGNGDGEGQGEEAVHLTAIGPTPQRDGMVMGIFDMMSNPGSGRHLWSGGMQQSPSSKKRKVDALATHDKGEEALVAATPEQRRQSSHGDLLQFLGGATPATGRAKHSRTPVSEGRKFMLSQFFATPSAVRYSQILQSGTPLKVEEIAMGKTPLKSHVLGLTPTTKRIVAEEKDKTPNYLKRSHSFKDRLISASTASATMTEMRKKSLDPSLSPISVRSGSSLMKSKAKFQPKPLSQIAAEMRQREQERMNVEGDDEDGMDALREIEDTELNVHSGQDAVEGEGEPVVTRTYKKKGQKRTTRRVIMRPQPKLKQARPPAEKGGEASDEDERVEETRLPEQNSNVGGGNDDEWSDDELFQALAADENNYDSDDINDDEFDEAAKPAKKRSRSAKALGKQDKPLGRAPKATKTAKPVAGNEGDEETRMYNPNATAHMNFKTLKIKNKNSKGKFKGGRGGRFRGRR